MNYKEARRKYFEHYVEFEWNIKTIVKMLNKLQGKEFNEHKLSEKIEWLASKEHKNLLSSSGVSKKVLVLHKNLRNNLAHRHKAKTVAPRDLKHLKEIKAMNLMLLGVVYSIRHDQDNIENN